MPTFEDIFANLKPYIDEYGIKRAGVFGSYARGQAKESSDIDLIFDFQKDFGLFDLLRFKIDLEEKLGKNVDILEFSSIDPSIRENILREVVMIYEQG
ncbi:MAG: nucleotidyltransferase family protein [Ruminiclostridium sp.]|nr:nucleotidyltransferase family protein [Ruminiclostridium sp.]